MKIMNNKNMINNNQIMNINQMMNNNNNSIYNNNQNNNKLNDNEMQKQLTELDYMRKKINIYKERISTLEELIKQKDFEIDNLKNRLSSNFCYIQNVQPINYNPMMMMEQMNNFKYKIDNINKINDNNKARNEKKKDIVKDLILIFEFNGQKIHIQSQSNEKMQLVIKKFCAKAGIEAESKFFISNGKELIHDLTIDENDISDQSIILVADKINKSLANNKKDEMQMKNIHMKHYDNPAIQLIFRLDGREIFFMVNKDTRFSEAIEEFLMKASIGNKEDISCLYNSRLLGTNDNRTIKEIFGDKNNIAIDVILTSGVIGA